MLLKQNSREAKKRCGVNNQKWPYAVVQSGFFSLVFFEQPKLPSRALP